MSDAPATAPAEVNEDGQILTHTTAPEHRRRKRRIVAPRPPPEETEPTNDDGAEDDDPMRRIVERHAKPDSEPPKAETSDDEESEVPDVEFVSEEELDIAPPDMEPRRLRRQKVTISAIELEDEATSGPDGESSKPPKDPKSLEELSGTDFNGQWKIRVIRKEPKVGPNGKRVDGEQKSIERYMDTQEFADLYGGLVYELTLLGPPKNGPKFDGAHKPIFRPYSKPFSLTIPGALANPETCIGFKSDDEDDDMTTDSEGYRRPRPGIATNADARMHEANLEQKRHEQAQREEDRRRREMRAREQEHERKREEGGIADAFARMHATSTESQNQMYQTLTSSQAEMIRTLANGRPGASGEETRYLHEALERLQSSNQGYINKLNDNHQAQLERLQNQHREELVRQDTQHRAELARLQDQVTAERARGDEIVRTAERNFNDRAREVEKRSDKDISDARREATERVDNSRRDFETRIADLTSRHADRYQDLKENHERDLKNRDAKWEMQIASERSAFDSRMAVKDHEVKLLREENARLREENAKPIHERVREITETAEALGMKRAEDIPQGEPDDTPQNWQQIFFRMGSDAVQNLPQIISSASEAVQRLRQGGTPAQQQAFVRHQNAQMAQAAASHPAAMSMPPAFAMEGEDDFRAFSGASGQMPGPMFTPAGLPEQAPQPPSVAVEQAPFITPAVAPAPPAPAPAAPLAVVQPSVPPEQAPTPSVAPPAPNGAAAGPDPALDPYILQYQKPFEDAMASGATARELAEHLMKSFPPAMMTTIVPAISADAIRAVLQRNGHANSPLCRRDGQKYLRAVKAELEALLRAQA